MTKTNNIAFQGVLGAYSHMACQAHCPDLTPLPCASFSDMIAMVQDGGADCAMVPVENSTAGRVADIHHLLPESGLFIIAEHYQPVAHKLLGIKGAQLSDITEVHSHEQGLAQCRLTLQKMGIKPVIHSDTAGAAKDIAARGERHVGAIASALAGDIYGLDTVQDTITDKVTNTTRFLIMSRERVVPQDVTAPAMTTIIFEVRSVPAVLYKALGGFATNGINLTKLESYMLDGSMNAARFYVDCEGHPETDSMKLALEELQFYCTDGGIRVLGTYLTNR
jgi:prephenate dehydratase